MCVPHARCCVYVVLEFKNKSLKIIGFHSKPLCFLVLFMQVLKFCLRFTPSRFRTSSWSEGSKSQEGTRYNLAQTIH